MTRQAELFAAPAPAGEQLVALRLDGEPYPWQRPTPVKRGRYTVQVFTDDYKRWRLAAIATVTSWWAPRPTIRVPVVAAVDAVFARPASLPTSYTLGGIEYPIPFDETDGRLPYIGVCDCDNVAKGVLDVMQRGDRWGAPVLHDDRLVVELRVRKFFAAVGERPHTAVRLWRA